MNDIQRSVLGHVAATLFGAPAPDEPVTGEVIAEAAQQGVMALMPIENAMEYWMLLRRNVMVVAAHQKLHKLMMENGIPYVVLKGVASAAYYPEPDRRLMGDVDFIVKDEDFDRACAVMEAAGYVGKMDMQEHHVCYDTEMGRWELHWRAPGFPEGHVIEEYGQGLVDQATEHDGCMCPSVFHHGLILLSHSAVHWINTGIGLRHLCDWAVFIAKMPDSEFCDLFEKPLRRVGLWRYAQLITQMCTRYLGVPEKSWTGPLDAAYVDALMDDVFDSGNFGIKDRERLNQAKLMTDDGSKSVAESGMASQLMRTLVNRACLMWPVCNKVKLLIPVAVVVVSVRHLYRIARGKRPEIHVQEMVSGAMKRKQLYQPFELFKTK